MAMRLLILVLYGVLLFLAFNQLDSYMLDLIAALRGQLILVSFLPVGLCYFYSKKVASSLLVLSTILTLVHFKPYSSNQREVGDIKVTQINLQYSNPNLQQIIYNQMIEEKNDILVLLEFNDTQRHVLDNLNTEYHLFGYAEVEGAPFGIIVISKLPIIQKQIKRFDNPKLGYVKLSFLHNNIMLNSLVFHPPSPRDRTLWTQRNSVLSKVQNEIKTLGGNWLIAGDFNTVPWSRYFIEADNNCFDRSGFYVTWPSKIQFNGSPVLGLPIDHCIASEKIRLTNINTSFVKGSDHRSLTYEVKLSKQ